MKKIINPWRNHPEYNCFGCCPENPIGLHMEFYEDGEYIVSTWHPEKNYQGWVNTMHGGILSTLIDEVCGWVVTRKLQTSGYTVQLNVKFRKAVSTTEPELTIRAKVTKQVRNLVYINAEKMGIDLSTVEYVFISHGHSDHAGGLKHFMEINDKAKVIVSPDALKEKFYSKRRCLHSITTEWPEIPSERLLTIDQSESISDDIFILAHIPQIHPMPEGNQHLFVENSDGSCVNVFVKPDEQSDACISSAMARKGRMISNDDFRHELALYTDGLLFTGCAHSGLENILAACPFPVNTVVGGFHLLDNHESEDKLSELAYRLTDAYPQTQFYTSHCTGDAVFASLHHVMGDKIHAFSCGMEQTI